MSFVFAAAVVVIVLVVDYDSPKVIFILQKKKEMNSSNKSGFLEPSFLIFYLDRDFR